MSHQDPFAGRSTTCIACGRDPGLKHWHDRGNLLCWPCWLRVEYHVQRLGGSARQVIDICHRFRAGQSEPMLAAEIVVLVAIEMIVERV